MPEAPDLQVIKEVLTRRIVGREIIQARVVRSTVLRSLAGQEFSGDIVGRTIQSIARRGKYLLLSLTGERSLVVNPMLTGTFRLCAPSQGSPSAPALSWHSRMTWTPVHRRQADGPGVLRITPSA